MSIFTMAAIGIYLLIAYQKKIFPFTETEKGATTLPQKTIDDYSMEELRRAYFKKLVDKTNLSPELVRLENDFIAMVQRIEELVRIEYPQSRWKFRQKNVGASIILNTKIDIDIITFDASIEKRTVIVRDRKAVDFVTVCNVTTDYGERSPSEEFCKKEEEKQDKEQEAAKTTPEIESEVRKETSDKEKIDKKETVLQWIEENFEYLEELRREELQRGSNFIVIPKEKYEEEAGKEICSFLVEKCGYENSSITQEGIIATIYIEN